MLYYQGIDVPALELLKKLFGIEIFSNLRLAGGTALALQIGHRKSIDIDLFGKLTADDFSITNQLIKIGTVTTLSKSTNIKVLLVNGIKVDLVNYPYPWLEKQEIYDSLRLAGKKDIAAMKLAAITGRGTKKDFTDLYFLLQEISLKEMLGLYLKKYYDGSEFLVLKSLSYFADADTDEKLLMLKQVSWEKIKNFIKIKVEEYVNAL